MSGGHFDYADQRAKDEIFGWSDKPKDVFEDMELSQLVFDVFDLIHDFDWYISGDTCSGTWNEKRKAFKDKWLTTPGREVVFNHIIDDAIAKLRRDLLEDRKYCHQCKHWKAEGEPPYGGCDMHKHCRWHYMEDACEYFEQ